jgi:anti-sigma regulatory factor (Ser/Thr protein kinase)/CheY-like chemotaxis protein
LTAPSILIAHAEHKTRRIVERVLTGLGVALDVVDDLEQAARRLADHPPALIVLDGAAAAAGRAELLAATRARDAETCMTLLDAEQLAQLPAILDLNAVSHLLVQPARLTEQLTLTVHKLVRGDLFGAQKYLLWGTALHQTALTRGSQRSHVVGELAEQVRARGLAARIASTAMLVADELLSNAVHHAPVDEHGAHHRAELPRDRELELDDRHQVQLRWGCDGRYLAVEVTDRFGSLARNAALRALVHERVKDSGCGAGMGIALTYRSCDHLVFNLAPGTRTEVIALIDVRRQHQTPGERVAASSYNVFVER